MLRDLGAALMFRSELPVAIYKKFKKPKHRGQPLRCVTCLLTEDLHADRIALCENFYNPGQGLHVKGRHAQEG